jgi:hypothetical protein
VNPALSTLFYLYSENVAFSPLWTPGTPESCHCHTLLRRAPQPTRATGESPYDSVGRCRRAYYRRTSRATCSSCSALSVSTVSLRKLFPPAQCTLLSPLAFVTKSLLSSSQLPISHVVPAPFRRPHWLPQSASSLNSHDRFMASCAKLTSVTLIPTSTIPMRARGVCPLQHLSSPRPKPDHVAPIAHPTLRRNSPADVIANFKRRVPPRLPKPRKRPEDSALTSGTPRVAVSGLLSCASSQSDTLKGRARGFSAPGSYTQPQPTWQSATPFGQAHSRQALPPLAPLSTSSDMPLYPSGPHSSYLSHQGQPGNGLHHRSSHGSLLHPLTPATPDDPHSPHHLTPGGYPSQGYGSQSARDGGSMFLTGSHGSNQGHGYPSHYQDPGAGSHNNWSFLPPLQTGNTSGPLSSLLNPAAARSGGLQKQHSYPSPSSAIPVQGNNASVSPDSRPTTGYSVASSSMSIPYDEINGDYRPRSSAGRPMTPTAMNTARPGSSHGRPSSAIGPNAPLPPPPSNLRIGRARRHSQAVSPYPSPYYDMNNDGRPVTAPDNSSVHRVRSFPTLPQVDSIGEEASGQPPFVGFNGSHADFAYNAGASAPNSGLDAMDSGWMNGSSQVSHGPGQPRPDTAHSTMSAHSSTSVTQTPPMDTSFPGHEADINRCEFA